MSNTLMNLKTPKVNDYIMNRLSQQSTIKKQIDDQEPDFNFEE